MAVYKCAGRKRSDSDGEPYCTYEALHRWRGRCPGCHRYYDCDKVGAEKQGGKARVTAAKSDEVKVEYVSTGIEGLDVVLGGGLVRGNVILFGGPQGTGKTSLLMEACNSLTLETGRRALYASGEEHVDRVLVICQRLGIRNDKIEIMGRDDAHDVDNILHRCDELNPLVVVIDSLQVVQSESFVGAPGSLTQSEGIAKLVNDYCKRKHMCAFLVNHMNKDLDFKGGTGVTHEVDALVALYKFTEADDGKAVDVFGKKSIREMGIPLDANNFDKLLAERIRTLVVGGKSRQGNIGARAFFEMTATGQLQALQQRSSLDIGGG